jgi:hypothetical protein
LKIAAFDQATVLGFAVGEAGGRPSWGSLRFDGHTAGEIHANFRAWLVRVMTSERPDICAFEKPYIPMPRVPRFAAAGTFHAAPAGIQMNPLTLRRLLWMAGCIEEVCEVFSIRCEELQPSEISKFLLGRTPKRTEKKAATIQAIRAYGFDVQDDNSADAVAMFLLMEATVAPGLASKRGFGSLFLPQSPTIGANRAISSPGRRGSRL